MGNSSSPSRAPAAEKLEVEVASPSCKRVASKSAGYDCVNNATVPQGRLRNQRNVAQKPWGGPPSCDPAPLTTSLRGLWVSGNAGTGQWLLRTKGRRPKNRPSDTRGGDPKTDLRKEELSKQLGREGREPKDPGVEAPLAAAGCRGNCRRVLDGLDLSIFHVLFAIVDYCVVGLHETRSRLQHRVTRYRTFGGICRVFASLRLSLEPGLFFSFVASAALSVCMRHELVTSRSCRNAPPLVQRSMMQAGSCSDGRPIGGYSHRLQHGWKITSPSGCTRHWATLCYGVGSSV